MKKPALAFRMHFSAPSTAYGASGLATSSEDVPVRAHATTNHAHASLLSENVTLTFAGIVAPVLIHHNNELRHSGVQMTICP